MEEDEINVVPTIRNDNNLITSIRTDVVAGDTHPKMTKTGQKMDYTTSLLLPVSSKTVVVEGDEETKVVPSLSSVFPSSNKIQNRRPNNRNDSIYGDIHENHGKDDDDSPNKNEDTSIINFDGVYVTNNGSMKNDGVGKDTPHTTPTTTTTDTEEEKHHDSLTVKESKNRPYSGDTEVVDEKDITGGREYKPTSNFLDVNFDQPPLPMMQYDQQISLGGGEQGQMQEESSNTKEEDQQPSSKRNKTNIHNRNSSVVENKERKLPKRNSHLLDIWGHIPPKDVTVTCPNCNKVVGVSRFTIHLEKCMGFNFNTRKSSM